MERLSNEMPLAELLGWHVMYRAEDEYRAKEAEKARREANRRR